MEARVGCMEVIVLTRSSSMRAGRWGVQCTERRACGGPQIAGSGTFEVPEIDGDGAYGDGDVETGVVRERRGAAPCEGVEICAEACGDLAKATEGRCGRT